MSWPSISRKSPRKSLVDDVQRAAVRTVGDHPQLTAWPELVALKTTEQDGGWHAEGDVLTHTDMVLEECEAIESELSSDWDREVLRLAALFHDIAKSRTTRYDEELKRVIARGHERMGAVQTRYCLHGSDLSAEQRRMVAALVGTHHLVKRNVARAEEPESIAELERLAASVDTKLLWALEMADMRGRICVDQEKQIETVQLFRMLCEERGIFGNAPLPWLTEENLSELHFGSDLARRWVLGETERQRFRGTMRDQWQAMAFAHEHRNSVHPEVIIPIGISGSGKSTAIAELSDEWVRISPDETRESLYGSADEQGNPSEVYRACRESLQQVLRKKGKAVYDATNIIEDYRAKVLNLCYDYGALVTYWIFDVSRETALGRNRQRERQVPERVIDAQMSRFSWPLPGEAHEVKVIDD